MNKTACYAAGIARALVDSGLIKIAMDDDVAMHAGGGVNTNNPAEILEQVFQSDDSCESPGYITPDNTTKANPKDMNRSVHWGPKVAPDATNTFGKFINSTGSGTDYPTL